MSDWIFYIPVGFVWFIIFWIVGGVIFSIAALFKIAKLRKAQFSCLFTITCVGCAYGATHSAFLIGNSQVGACLNQAQDIFGKFASVIACGIFPITAMGIIWFIALMLVGAVLLYISRAKNQSWVDKKLDETIPEPISQISEFHIH
ncbi:MAG: hypothetical protein ABIA83_00025 [Patescibacteria group bacterium]